MQPEENFSFNDSETHSPQLNLQKTLTLPSKFIPNNLRKPSETSSISSLVEESSSSCKEKRPESKKSHSFSTNQEKALLMEMRNRTIKSNRTDQDPDFLFQNFQKIIPEKHSEETVKKAPKIVNINKILMKTRRILRAVRRKLLMREFQKTTTRKIQFINDITMEIIEKKKTLTKTQRYCGFLIYFAKKIFEFSKALLFFTLQNIVLWKIFYVFIVILTSFFISLEYAFQINTLLHEFPVLNLVFPTFLLNIFLEFAVEQKNNHAIPWKKLFINYIKSSFFVDLTTFCILLLLMSEIISYKDFPSVIYLIQLYDYFPLKNLIQKKFFLSNKPLSLLFITDILLKTLAIAHFLACISYYFSYKTQNFQDLFEIYLAYFNESLSLLFLMSNSQKNSDLILLKSIGFNCVATVLSGFWFIYLIKLCLGYDNNENNDENNEVFFFRYLKKLNLKHELIVKIKEYLDFSKKDDPKSLISLGTNEAFNKLTPILRENLLSAGQDKVFGKIPLLQMNFSKVFLRKLLPKMIVENYNPENIIYNKEDNGSKYLFIIAFGKVELFVNLGKKQNIQHTFKTIPQGETFGELSFFVDSPKSHFAKALTPLSLYKISREDFLDLLKSSPEDYEKYCMIKDSLALYNNFSVLQTKCNCCQAKDHDIEHCPYLTLQMNRQSIIRRYNFSRGQERRPQPRRPPKKLNALRYFREIESKALKIEIPANFSSSCDNPSENSEDNNSSNNNIINSSANSLPPQQKRSNSLVKAPPKSPKLLDSPNNKDSSLRCYETLDDINAPPRRSSSKKQLSLLEGVSSNASKRIEKREDSWKKSMNEIVDPSTINQRFCSLEILMQEKSQRRKSSELELVKTISEEEKDKDKEKEEIVSVTNSQNTTYNSKIFGASQQKISKFGSSKEEIAKRNSSFGNFSLNSIQNINNFFTTDEVLGGTTKGGTTTVATIQEFLLKNFETMGNFKIYFPHNNFENVIKWCRILQKGKKK